MDTTLQHLVRYLTHDDIEVFIDRYGEAWTYRVRIWQGKEAVPVVLMTGVDCPPPPLHGTDFVDTIGHMTEKAANFVNSAILGHPVTGMIVFEQNCVTSAEIDQLHFEYFGNVHRVVMYSPTRVALPWSRLEEIIGEKIER